MSVYVCVCVSESVYVSECVYVCVSECVCMFGDFHILVNSLHNISFNVEIE